ncbi:type IV toxin-antitoxin system AbiEi family antitoxin domain-containing protein [Nocardioides sp.]|uniref:type IV toxin-antitoxin system AbiEi family antitoxin domain-containing protein n=1 Tax=Nocardioides sp. TaxID=35761 RepID=UPI00356514AC
MTEPLIDPRPGESVFLRRDALAEGYDDRAIARMVRTGAWHRIRRGAYVPAELWRGADTMTQHELLAHAVHRQAQAEVALSHVSALWAYGAPDWGVDLSTVHLTRLDGRGGRREAGVCQHVGHLVPDDLVRFGTVLITSPTRTALDASTVLGTEAALVVMDHFLHRGLTTRELLAERYASMTGWPFTLKTDLVLRLADGRSESPGETRTRYLCWRQSLPKPELQYPITDEFGRVVAVADCAWPGHGAFLEFDGRVKYERLLRPGESPSEVVVREKRREERIRELTGWRCIRLMWSDLEHPARTAERIRRVLAAGSPL